MAKCKTSMANAEKAAAEAGVHAESVKVDGLGEIAARGVLMTPALAIDGEIKAVGRIPTVDEITTWIS